MNSYRVFKNHLEKVEIEFSALEAAFDGDDDDIIKRSQELEPSGLKILEHRHVFLKNEEEEFFNSPL
jgi:hypothetical protein